MKNKIAIVTLKGNDGIASLSKEFQRRKIICDMIFSSIYHDDSRYDDFLNTLLQYDIIYFRVLSNKSFASKLLKDLRLYNKYIVNSQYLKIPELTSKIFQMQQAESVNVSVPHFKEIFFRNISIESIQEFTTLPAILKASIGIAGRSVFLISSQSDIDAIDFSPDKVCIIQDFISYKRDIRVFTINGIIWNIMERRPGEGDFKANISQGGTGHSIQDISLVIKLEQLIKKLHPIFRVEIAGYDFLETENGEIYFLEINSNPGWKGLDKALKIKTAKPVADYIESLLKNSDSVFHQQASLE